MSESSGESSSYDSDPQTEGKSDFGDYRIIDFSNEAFLTRPVKEPVWLGKYLLGELLGRGTFADVKEVLDSDTLVRRAVKVINLRTMAKKVPENSAYKMVSEEIKLWRRLKHNNIIKLIDTFTDVYQPEYDEEKLVENEQENTDNLELNTNQNAYAKSTEEDDGKKDGRKTTDNEESTYSVPIALPRRRKKREQHIYIVMEYCAASLREMIPFSNDINIPGKKLPQFQAQFYFRQLIDGVEYLHGQHVIHKDIKPENMLVNCNGCIKLTDFGVSEVINTFSKQDWCKQIYGSRLYQPLEIIGRDNAARFLGSKVDIWACGVTLFNMVTGTFPYKADNEMDLLAALQNEEHDYSLINDNHLLHLISNILKNDPNERYTIDGIRKSSWFKMLQAKTEDEVPIPPRNEMADKYRSLTITPYLKELNDPTIIDRNAAKLTETQYDEIMNRLNIPWVRSNRTSHLKRKYTYSTWNSLHRSFGILGLW